MSKIAVCMSGHPRYVEIGYQHLSKSLEPLDVDYFFHLWDDHENEEVLDIYKPKAFLFEKPKVFEDDLNLPHNNGKSTAGTCPFSGDNFMSMLYSRFTAGQIMKNYIETNNKTYDHVMWTRTDICPLKNIAEELSDNETFYSSFVEGDEWFDTHLNTTLVVSNLQNVLRYLDLYNHYRELFKQGVYYCDHKMSMTHMKKFNIKFDSILGDKGAQKGNHLSRQWRFARPHGLSTC